MLLITYDTPTGRPIKIYKRYSDNSDTVFSIIDKKDYANNDSLCKAISSRNAYFNRVLKQLVSDCQIQKSISMHCARHTFATIGLDIGIPIEIMQDILGHKNIRETQIYVNILGKNLDRSIDLFDDYES